MFNNNSKIPAFLMFLLFISVDQKYVSWSELASFYNMNMLIHFFWKKNYAYYVSSVTFERHWGILSRQVTWYFLLWNMRHCFSPSTAFKCVLPDLSSSAFDNMTRSCRFPVRFSCKSSLALTMDLFRDVKKSRRV